MLPVRRPGRYGQSALVLGTAQLGGPYGIANTTGRPDDEAVSRLLSTAAELGVTHLDTARAYGDSEHRIGAALGDLPLRVVTKVAPLPANGGPAEVEASVRRSLAELGPRGPFTILFHRASDAVVHWKSLHLYLSEGVAERVGVSVQSPDELRAVLDLPDLGYIQLPCNVLDTRWLLPDLADALAAHPHLVVTVRSVYLQGLLAAGPAVSWPHTPDPLRDEVVSTLDSLAAELGREDRTDLCVGYVLSLPWVTSVVVGAETEEQLRRNVALAGRPPLAAPERERVRQALPPVPPDLLNPSTWTR